MNEEMLDIALDTLTTKSDVDALVDARRSQIAELHSELYLLLCYRNTLGVVARVPAEVWAEIFSHLVAMHNSWADPRYLPAKSPSYHGWLPVTHVCRFWRLAALTSPRLWTNIVLTKRHDRIRAFIRRSGQLPLIIRLRLGPTIAYDLVEEIMEELHRIEVVGGLECDEDFEPPQNPELRRCAREEGYRYLRSLTIAVSPVWADELPFVSGVKMPALESLSFSRGTFACAETLIHSTLTSLTLKRLKRSILVTDIVRVLKRLPLLEHLNITRIKPENGAIIVPSEKIELSRLRSIFLGERGAGSASVSLVNHLRYPRETRIKFQLSGTAPDASYAHTLALIGARFAGEDTLFTTWGDSIDDIPPLTYFSFGVEDEYFTFSTGFQSFDNGNPRLPVATQQIFLLEFLEPDDCEAVVRNIIEALPCLRQARNISMNGVGIEKATWATIGRSENVESIDCMQRGPLAGLLDALDEASTGNDQDFLRCFSLLEITGLEWLCDGFKPASSAKSLAGRLAVTLMERQRKFGYGCNVKICPTPDLTTTERTMLEEAVEQLELGDFRYQSPQISCGVRSYHIQP